MLLAAAACRPNSMGAGDQPDPLNGGAIFEDVIAYTEFGTHRTASRGDLETSSWLADELRSAGFEVDLQRWTLDQFDLDECQVEVGDRVLECFPFWLPASLPEGGLTAELVRVGPESDTEDLDGRIAFMDSETVGAGHFKLGVSERIIDSGAIGSVYVVARDTGEIVAQNAVPPFDKNRLPIPAVIVGQKDEASLLSAADNRDEIRLQVDGWLVEEAEAFNVLGRLERGPWWIVVSTPTSGWFDCGGERGPGVAMWLALLSFCRHVGPRARLHGCSRICRFQGGAAAGQGRDLAPPWGFDRHSPVGTIGGRMETAPCQESRQSGGLTGDRAHSQSRVFRGAGAESTRR
jgi:hypothetical protein